MNYKKKKNLEETYERIINVGLCIVPYEDLSDLAAPELMLFGTTKDEKIFSFSELDAMFKSQYEQMVGFVPSLDRKRLFTRFSNDGNNAFITEEVTLTISSPEEVNTIFIRCSCVMEYIDNRWKLTHWHASTPVDTENDHWHMEEWKREKEKLQKLVDQQTTDLYLKNRELEIEAALERVRARSMGMHKSDDLIDVVREIGKGIHELGIQLHHSQIYTDYDYTYDPKTGVNIWVDVEGQDYLEKFHLPYIDHTITLNFINALNEGLDYFNDRYSKAEKDSYFKLLFKYSDLKRIPKKRKELILNASGWTRFTVILNEAALNFGRYNLDEFTDEEQEIFIRFAKVFGQAYTRFLDLKKAEEQVREAKIEAALEKVRSRTMGMQSSDELPEVANMLFLEVQALGIPAWSSGFNILAEDKRSADAWMSSEGTLQDPFTLRLYGEASFDEMGDFLRRNEHFMVQELGGEALQEHYKYMKTFPDLKPTFKKLEEQGLSLPSYQINHLCKFSNGFLLFITYEPVPEAHDIFKRFTRVFDQTYTRFLDLKKAEKQARESRIEAALERVRSRAMAMQTSDELKDVALELRTQMGLLGQKDLEVCAIHLYEEHEDLFESWGAMHAQGEEDKLIQGQALFPKSGSLIIDEMMDYYASDQREYVLVNEGEKAEQWFELLKEYSPDAYEYISDAAANLASNEMKAYWAMSDFSGGSLVMVTYSYPDEDSRNLLRKTANVFGLAYKRFRDLQKAEESTRRARQQASLDRVRADISSMRSAEDLDRVTPLIWNELTTLGIPFIRCGVFIMHEDEEQIEVYLSKPDGTSLAMMHLGFDSNDLTVRSVNAWQKGSVYKQHWTREEFLEWGQSMMEQGQVSDLESYQGAEEAPDSLHLQFLPFNQGMLYVGSTNPLDEEEISLSESLAKAFSIAYSRYEDFVKLEKAKAGIEEALTELKATQSQLVQQEKLASLGQLTAGIAHEIKNPLNFVNNFSEVSIEMVDEAREELSAVSRQLSGDDKEKVEDALEVLNDIEANLRKIHEHGSRADSIVKSMLQHSRGGDGKMEPSPLNPLIKEYVNLAFHGMRAGKEPINLDIDLQLDEKVGEVPLIAEDFSRVILNLCNNAFDAIRDKQTIDGGSETEYIPKLIVRTKSENGHITIEIEDNGPGIPDDIKDKILQPFFTTKKGTQGTGLGLSITHDIIKAHGGTLDIESSHSGTKMIITLSKSSLIQNKNGSKGK